MGSLRKELLEILGAEGLRRLCAARGGRRAYIPCKPRDSHWLTAAVGREAAGKLAWRYGGDRIHVPACRRPRSDRDAAILRWRSEGLSVPAIAAAAGISERQVYNVLRG